MANKQILSNINIIEIEHIYIYVNFIGSKVNNL